MSESGDDLLSALFGGLRDADAIGAPAFPAMLGAAAMRAAASPRSRSAGYYWAAAAAVVLATGLIVSRSRTSDQIGRLADSTRRIGEPAPSITTWTSPTEALLRTSGSELLMPASILTSTLDVATRASVTRRGDRK